MLINPSSAIETLKVIVSARGTIPTVRVSSARSACPWSYYGTARGEIRARKRDGGLTCVSIERAPTQRRSWHLANVDARHVAESEGRLLFERLGTLDESDARIVLHGLGVIA